MVAERVRRGREQNGRHGNGAGGDGPEENAFRAIVEPPASPDLEDPMFDGLAGEIVNAVLPETEADPVAVLTHNLVAFGNVVNRGPHYLVEASRHGCNLFALVVGPTNHGRKGTAWDWSHTLFREVDELWAKTRIKGGMASGEGLIAELQDADPGMPEKDRRLLLIETEFGGIMKKMSREGNTLSALLRQAWDGSKLTSMTKLNPAVASNPHISLIGHVTPEELLELLDKTEVANGLVNRFCVVYVRRSKFLPEGGDITRVPVAELSLKLKSCALFAYSRQRLVRDEHARKRWAEIYEELSDRPPGQLGKVTSRAAPIVVRLSCLYALLDQTGIVSVKHLESAYAFWRYAEASAAFVFGESLGDPMAERLLKVIREHPEGVTRTQIRDLLSRNAEKVDVEHALRVLVNGAHIRQVKVEREGAGRRPEVWVATRAAAPPPNPGVYANRSSRSFRSSNGDRTHALTPPPHPEKNDINDGIPHTHNSLSSLSLLEGDSPRIPSSSVVGDPDRTDGSDEAELERRAIQEEGDAL